MIAERLAQLMAEKDMNASHLAQLSGTHRSYVRRVLRGERANPGAGVLAKWAKALGVTEQAFFSS